MRFTERRRETLSWVLTLIGLYWFASSFFLAKKSLPDVSSCDEAAGLLREWIGVSNRHIQQLETAGFLAAGFPRDGCWMPRQVDSLAILLVDALRFDFALYNLPHSVGRRLNNDERTRLFQFVADPPTVTMQRIKALTTGGLPTFADISANFGGATLEEDSWVRLLTEVDYQSRGLRSPSRTGFVGDDTWVDLFPPEYFAQAFPYPSFNTRDLDTVDNGCLEHIPDLVANLRTHDGQASQLEVMIVHFLGVDHVGHTYGPHNQHMDAKLKQMDEALTSVLDEIDATEDSCRAVFIFGDHGMTEDGNHGGGTEEEVNAALYIHTSPACGNTTNSLFLERTRHSDLTQKAFASVHQIDLVPSISFLLGLPIPYANLGSVAPSLLVPNHANAASAATALALNAAQVWRYFHSYSRHANKLPNLHILQTKLQVAASMFQEAIDRIDDPGSEEYFEQSAALFKLFLVEGLELGQRVWTRFDNFGMIAGIVILFIALLIKTVPLIYGIPWRLSKLQYWENATAVMFMFFYCGAQTFSNSYILEESHSIMYALAVISIVVAFRIQASKHVRKGRFWASVLVLPLASRIGDLYVSGHGMDPSIRLHIAHAAVTFLSSLMAMAAFRWYLHQQAFTQSSLQTYLDIITILLISLSWWEKRSLDEARNGFIFMSMALTALVLGMVLSVVQAVGYGRRQSEQNFVTLIFKVMLAILSVTGPSTAASAVLYTSQLLVMYTFSRTENSIGMSAFTFAALLKLLTRHIFFMTNHGCAFNRLQYSAAFVATVEFNFVLGGISLFLNTFGWEMLGIAFAWYFSRFTRLKALWKIYGALQLIEALASCISVAMLRRHLMVWDVYAPHFLFVAIFTVLTGLSHLTITLA